MDRRDGSRDHGGDRHRGRGRSPPRSRHSRRRSRSRDRRRGSGGGGGGAPAEEQNKLREMLLAEAAKRNPDAANVLQSTATDQDALQRALATANALSVANTQMQNLPQNPSDARGRGGFGTRIGGKPNESERVFLELHVGSLPDQIRDEQELIRFLGDALSQRNLALEPGNPVVSARINHVGHFAFVMFRSKEEATKALELNGTPCYGNTLRVDRPKGFANRQGGGMSQMDEAQMLSTALSSAPPVPNIPGLTREELRRRLEASITKYGQPSSLVLLSDLGSAPLEEVEDEVRRHGSVVGVRPKPDEAGAFFVKMSSIQEAEKLVQFKRTYMDRPVRAAFRPAIEWTS